MGGSLWLTLIATCILLTSTHSIFQRFPKVDLVFILDSSTSVGYDNYDKMKGFVKKFLHSANIDGGEVRVGLVSYSTQVTVEFQLNTYNTKAELFDAVDKVPWRYGSTNTADGLQTMHEEMFNRTNGDRPIVPNICIIMTDSVSNINYQRTIPEAEKAKDKGIHIYAIGIALQDLKEVNGIASEPASVNAFAVNSFDELEGLDEKIFESVCPVSTTAISTTTTTKPRDTGYDVVILLDSSVDNRRVFNQMKDFATNLVGNFSIDDEEYRIGLVRYSGDSDTFAHLKDLDTKQEVMDKIKDISYKPGKSNLQDALDIVNFENFREDNGDRDFARNLIVLLTGVDRSTDPYEAFRAAERAEYEGINIYTVGFYINDTFEVDEVPTHPLSTYRYLITRKQDVKDVPVMLANSVDDILRPRRDRPLPTTTTTTTTTTPPRDFGYDVVIMMDSSVPQKTFDAMKKYAKTLVNRFDIDNKEYTVGLMRYGECNDIQWNLNNYTSRKDIVYAIDRVGHKIGTSSNAAGAIRMVRRRMFNERNGDRDFARNLIFLMTANEKSDDIYARWNEAEEAEKEHINLYTIGFDLNDTTEIDETSTHPLYIYRHLINTEEGDDAINKSISEFVGLIDEDVLLRPRPKPTTITNTMMSLSTKPCGFEKIDLVITLDSSTSVGQNNFQKILEFCKDFLNKLDIDSGSVRVGILSYSTNVHDHFFLNAYSTSTDIFNAIDKIHWIFGSTNTADAIRDMRQRYFSFANGDRWDARNIALIFTDGVSNMNANRLQDEASHAKANGINMYAIGIGLSDVSELNLIASFPASNYTFNVENFDKLKDLNDRILPSLCAASEDLEPTRVRPQTKMTIKPDSAIQLPTSATTSNNLTTPHSPSTTMKQEKIPRNTGTALMVVVSVFLVLSVLVFGVAMFLFHKTLKQQGAVRNQLIEKHALNELGDTNRTADLHVEVPSENK